LAAFSANADAASADIARLPPATGAHPSRTAYLVPVGAPARRRAAETNHRPFRRVAPTFSGETLP
jgi:hypothetical protein